MRTRPLATPNHLLGAALALIVLGAPRTASAAWPPPGRTVSAAPGNQFRPVIASDGGGGAILAWIDFRDSTGTITAGHVLGSGELDARWPVNGRALRTDPLPLADEPENPTDPVIVPDGAGGAIVAWTEARDAVTSVDVFAQHVLESGQVDPAWPANGRRLTAATGRQVAPEIASDGAGGAIVTWLDGRALGTAGSTDVYAQHVLASGGLDSRWPLNGLPVSVADGPQEFPVIVADGSGGALFAWYDLRAGATSFDIYAHHVLGSGAVDPAWPVNGRDICSNPSDQFNPTIASDGAHGAIVAWDDNRNASFHPFAQHVRATGVVDPAWPVNGIAVSGAGVQEDFPKIVPDGAGGAIVAYQTRETAINVRAQHLRSTGVLDPAWPAQGRVLGPSGLNQTQASIVLDGAGGAVIAWRQDDRDILVQHVLATGALDAAYPAGGRLVHHGLSTQETGPVLTETAGGGVIVTWSDAPVVDLDIFAMEVQPPDTSGVPDPAPAPRAVAFAPPSPNPSRGLTTLHFNLARAARVRLNVYDAAGRPVRELAHGPLSEGDHEIPWDLRDGRGQAVGAGLYFARLEADGRVVTRRIVALK